MLSDKLKKNKSPKKRNPIPNAWYPDSQKMEALKLWLITGNLRAVSASLNIPYPTLQVWRYSEWWKEMATEIKTEGQIVLSNKLKAVAERAMEVTLDRLEHGDWLLNQKTGVMERKPVVMRDAHRVAESFIDRAVRLETKPIEEEHNKKVEDRLAQLAASFASFARKTTKVEVIDAVYDQREEGLQEGTQLGEDSGQASLSGPGEESPGPKAGGEGNGQLALGSTRGPQEGSEAGRGELPEQPTSDLSEVQPDQGS